MLLASTQVFHLTYSLWEHNVNISLFLVWCVDQSFSKANGISNFYFNIGNTVVINSNCWYTIYLRTSTQVINKSVNISNNSSSYYCYGFAPKVSLIMMRWLIFLL